MDISDDDPGATIVWFGQYKGMRLDNVPYDYVLWAVYSSDAETYSWVRIEISCRSLKLTAITPQFGESQHDRFAELHWRFVKAQWPRLPPDERPGNQQRRWSNWQPFRNVYRSRKWSAWCDENLSGHAVRSLVLFEAFGD